MKLLEKWLRVSRRRQVCTKMLNRPSKGQSGRGTSKAGTVRISKLKERRKRRYGRKKAENEKLEVILEQRRMEGCSLQVEVMQKAPEFVVQERMSQGKGVKK